MLNNKLLKYENTHSTAHPKIWPNSNNTKPEAIEIRMGFEPQARPCPRSPGRLLLILKAVLRCFHDDNSFRSDGIKGIARTHWQ
jgi:hypothetical protein